MELAIKRRNSKVCLEVHEPEFDGVATARALEPDRCWPVNLIVEERLDLHDSIAPRDHGEGTAAIRASKVALPVPTQLHLTSPPTAPARRGSIAVGTA
jgi:hypothetical protein